MRKQKSAPEEIPQLEGYSMEKRTVSIMAANVWALVVMVAMGIVGFVLIYWLYAPLRYSLFLGGPLILASLLGIVVHELIHGLTWMWVTHSSFKHLKFGLMTGRCTATLMCLCARGFTWRGA